MKLTKNLRRIAIAGGLLLCAALTWAVKATRQKETKPVPQLTRERRAPYDPKLLAKLNELTKTLDMTRTCAYTGTVSIRNISDSSSDIRDLPVVFFRKGERCYYQYGPDEMINGGGFNLLISHAQKKILLDKQKMVNTVAVGSLTAFTSGMASEHYQLSASEEGVSQTITLKNERHLTCREYNLTYNRSTGKVSRLFARLTDNQYPLDRARDKTLEMLITDWTNIPDEGKYPQWEQVLRLTDKRFYLQEKYKNYELINIIKSL